MPPCPHAQGHLQSPHLLLNLNLASSCSSHGHTHQDLPAASEKPASINPIPLVVAIAKCHPAPGFYNTVLGVFFPVDLYNGWGREGHVQKALEKGMTSNHLLSRLLRGDLYPTVLPQGQQEAGHGRQPNEGWQAAAGFKAVTRRGVKMLLKSR